MEEPHETTEEVYLYVDFDNKIKDDVFQNKFFLRMTNLGTETPLVQVNNELFKGHYEDCVGTNLFFKDIYKPPDYCPFNEKSRIHLEHTVSQFKVLALTPVRIPSKVKDIPEPDYDVEINANYEYEELLELLANGSLNLEDNMKIVPKVNRNSPEPELVVPHIEEQMEGEITIEKHDIKFEDKEPEIIEECQDEVETVDILTYKYEKLKQLARRPARRKLLTESVAECELKYQKQYEYNSLKSQIMMPSDYFPVITKKFNKETLVGAVDIDRSVLQGFIKPSQEFYRILTEDEKSSLLCMQNMHNLSMPARYFVLKSQLEYLELLSLTETEEKLSEKDQFGRTIQETVEIYRRLVRVVNGLIEQKYYYNSECETDDDESIDDNQSKNVTLNDRQEAEGSMEVDNET